jgi:TolB-like protein/Tfp pilus assembly protein PilF
LSFFDELKRRNVLRVGIAYVVIGWLVAQVLQLVLETFTAPDWVMKTVLVLIIAGLPFVLVFAWAFEMTPEGIKREHEVDRSQSITNKTGRKLDFIVIGILVVALGYFVYDKFVLSIQAPNETAESTETNSTNPEETEVSIAVLPLANRSSREEDLFFTDGIHDDLLTQLAKVASLKVISRTSVMRYRDTEMPIPEIAEQLGVSTILEGGIQRSGDQIRINVQLIEANTDKHLWAETYDRQMTADNLFAIQSEITLKIIDALKATLTLEEAARIEEKPTQSLEAWQEYMKGQQLLALRTATSIEQAKKHFENAVELDGQLSLAIVGLANAYHLLFEYAGWSERESLDVAMDLVSKALAQSPDLGEAYMVLGELDRHSNDLVAAEANFQRAIELIPGNANVWHWYSFVKDEQGQRKDAEALMQRAHQLDPMSPVIHNNYALQPFYDGRDEESLEELERVKALHPDYPNPYLSQSWILAIQGDVLGSLRARLKANELDPDSNRYIFTCQHYNELQANESALNCMNQISGRLSMDRIWNQVIIHLDDGDVSAAKAFLALYPQVPMDADLLGSVALLARDFELAKTAFQMDQPQWFSESFNPDVDQDNYWEAVYVASIFKKDGEKEKAESLLNESLKVMKGFPRNRGVYAYGCLDVAAYSLLDENETALNMMEECAELEYLTDWRQFAFSPLYDGIRDDPRFSAAMRKLGQAAGRLRAQAISEGLL